MIVSNTFDGLRLATNALLAHQAALDTIGQNLANVSTPGYRRERADLAALPQRGGVDAREIQRLHDRFFDFAVLTEQQLLGRSRAEDATLQRDRKSTRLNSSHRL